MNFLVKEKRDKFKTIQLVNLRNFQYMKVMSLKVPCFSIQSPKMRVW